MATTENAIFSKRVSPRMLGLSLHVWEDIMLLSLGAAALAALFVIVSTYAVVQLQREANREATTLIAEANSQAEHARAAASGSTAIAADAHRRAARATKSASEANERAAQLEKDAAIARKETAEATARAAEADLARAKLEARLEPRQIDRSSQTLIQSRLSPFKSIRLDIVWYSGGMPDDGEAMTGMLHEPLHAAGWWIRTWQARNAARFEHGIMVHTRVDAPPDFVEAANELVSALRDIGLDVGLGEQFVTNDLPGTDPLNSRAWAYQAKDPSPMRLLIGSKP